MLLSVRAIVAEEVPDPVAALEKCRAFLSPALSSVSVLKIREYENRRAVGGTQVRVFGREVPGVEPSASLCVFLAPKRDRGKVLLRRGNQMWFRTVKAQRPTEIGGRQKVMGRITNRDVFSFNLLHHYKADEIVADQVSLPGGEDQSVWRIALHADGGNRTAEAMELFVDRRDFRPYLAKVYTRGGSLQATIVYQDFRKNNGHVLPYSITILDGNDPALVMLITIQEIKWEKVPVSWFDPAAIPSPDELTEYE